MESKRGQQDLWKRYLLVTVVTYKIVLPRSGGEQQVHQLLTRRDVSIPTSPSANNPSNSSYF